MEKEVKDWTFQELLDYNTMKIHLGLLEEGSKGMKNAVFMAQQLTLQWNKERTQ